MRSLTSAFSACPCKVRKISRPLLTVDDLICMLEEGFYACIQLQKVIKWSKVLPINGSHHSCQIGLTRCRQILSVAGLKQHLISTGINQHILQAL